MDKKHLKSLDYIKVTDGITVEYLAIGYLHRRNGVEILIKTTHEDDIEELKKLNAELEYINEAIKLIRSISKGILYE